LKQCYDVVRAFEDTDGIFTADFSNSIFNVGYADNFSDKKKHKDCGILRKTEFG